MELIVSTRPHVKLKTSLLFILKSSQTENYLQVVVLNFRKGADDMKEISFPVVTFVPAGVKYFNSLDYNDIVVLVVYLDDIVAGLAVEPTLV